MNPFQKKEPNYSGLAAALAAVIGGAVGIAVAYQKSGIHKDVEAKAKVLAKDFQKNRKAIQANVQEIFGQVSEDLEKVYVDVHSHVMAAKDQLGAQLNEKNFNKTIEQIVEQFSKAQKWSKQTADKFTKNLMQEWGKQSKALSKEGKTVVKKAKKAVASEVKVAKKTVAKSKKPTKK